MTFFLALAVALPAAGCHHHHGPTEPRFAFPAISGDWSGTFTSTSSTQASMRLTGGDAGTLRGVVQIGADSVNITGTETSTAFTFQTTAGSCPAVSGQLAFTESGDTVTRMAGAATETACPSGSQPVSGTLDLRR